LRLPAAALPVALPAEADAAVAGVDPAASSWTVSLLSASRGDAAAAPYVVLIVVCRLARRGGNGGGANRRSAFVSLWRHVRLVGRHATTTTGKKANDD